ncbi:hypothetical protein BpHYR1_038351 [Brachionus plicatilis]|uniref:Uncharacterized protein n=1 Tax=Brachionus plicatilis TaxID=10195 RepID=A0A3M7RDJ1_BRAPC|nr:hypothetical protein BpHYR1_038351 [Brachionus plicatilis]
MSNIIFLFINNIKNSSAHVRPLEFTESFISLISLSISSINEIIKSTNFCLYINSECVFVIKKLMS